MNIGIEIAYLVASVLFIIGIKYLGKTKDARKGNVISAVGMVIAIAATLFTLEVLTLLEIAIAILVGTAIGLYYAQKVAMTKIPEMVALFNGFGGLASFAVALSDYYFKRDTNLASLDAINLTSILVSVLIGAVTFTGSMVAYLKLDGKISGQPITFKGQHLLNLLLLIAFVAASVLVFLDPSQVNYIVILIVISLLLGILTVIPIGGADMPVVESLLNSLSGIAAAFTGFIIGNSVLIIAGSLVGASGLILTFIMCKAMNRTLPDVLFKSFGGSEKQSLTRTKVGSDAEEVAMMVDGAQKIIIVPGYGMAVSQCQHQVKEFADLLQEKFDTEVSYAIHPVAGRMPGHMNVLLAEANVPYEQLIEMDEINSEFPDCDVALVIGANDTTNPAARSGEGPLAGMPIIDADMARTVVIVKRSLSVGYAGVDNDLFYMDKTMMLFGDGKKMITQLNNSIKEI